MQRTVSEPGLHLVMAFEGFYPAAYRCPAGVWTIGYGHTAGVKPGNHIDQEDAEALLIDDLTACGQDVDRLVKVPLNDNQFAALASFVFNLGAGALASSTLLRRLNAGDYGAVPGEMKRWVYIKDPKTGAKVKLPGLVRRRNAEAELWMANPADRMPQAVLHHDVTP